MASVRLLPPLVVLLKAAFFVPVPPKAKEQACFRRC